jgi:hypothetical protein
MPIACPPLKSSGAKKAPRERGLSLGGTSNDRICGMIDKQETSSAIALAM